MVRGRGKRKTVQEEARSVQTGSGDVCAWDSTLLSKRRG